MIIHPEIEQGTEAWLDMRRAKITASEIGSFAIEQKEVRLTIKEVQGILDGLGIEYPKKAKADELKALIPERTAARLRTHTKTTIDARKALYAKKIAEKSGAEMLDQYCTKAMQRGNELEPEAFEVYRSISGEEVQRVGFVEHDNRLCGASPDGVVYGGKFNRIVAGLEIKCHLPETHIKYLLDPNSFIEEHQHQIHWQMAIMNCDRIALFGYCPKLPFIRFNVPRTVITNLYLDAIDELSSEYEASIDQYNDIWDRQKMDLAEIRQRQEGAA